MKPLRTLVAAPSGLATYLSDTELNHTWSNFRDQVGDSYHELRDALVQLQHGLCGYCEQTIPKDDTQVEHVIPQSISTNGHGHGLDPTNMIACCKGGTATNFYGPGTNQSDPDRVGDRSCGQAKMNTHNERFVDPRSLPKRPSLFKVGASGRIEADEAACQEMGIAKCRVDHTIEILGLDVDRLKRARAKRWQFINTSYSDYFDNPEVMQRAARSELLPDASGDLPPFFTTNRSYFMQFSDLVLKESDDSWV